VGASGFASAVGRQTTPTWRARWLCGRFLKRCTHAAEESGRG